MSRATRDGRNSRRRDFGTPPYFPPRFSLAVIGNRTIGRAASDAIAAASPTLRLILGITLLLLGIGSLSCHLQDSIGREPVVTPVGQWVRTVDGWERTDRWHASDLPVPRLHPLVVAAGQGLVSVMALVVCARDGQVARRCQQR
jgi:hypothetical protein